MLQSLSRTLLSLFGWKLDQRFSDSSKTVLIGAPHTSNWDFVLAMLAMSAMGYQFNWVAKQSMFFWPVAATFKKMGGVPLDRGQSRGFVDKCISLFDERQRFVLAIAPEGTRSLTTHWKSGFYRIAIGAEVPISFGYVDYKNKITGIGGSFMPTGNKSEDMQKVIDFYENIEGRFPEKQSPIKI